MSYTNELEDSLRACREIEKLLASGEINLETVQKKPEAAEKLDIIVSTDEEKDAFEAKIVDEEIVEEKIVEEDIEEKAESHPFLKSLLSILICLFTALLLALLITKFIAHHTSVEGSSMEHTLTDGDQIIVENISYYLHETERFDVIVFPHGEGVNYIKRIIGLPKETVQIVDGYVYINGKPLSDPLSNEVIEDGGLASEEILLGENEYFVLGDNRNGSMDSRTAEIGTVKRHQIRGKAWLRFYPFSQFGSIK